MKKYLIIIFAFLALSGYGQQDLKARYLNITRMLYSGTDSLISPADTLHQFNYMKMKDPVLSLDGVNKRSMERFVGDTAKLLHWADTLPTSGAGITTRYDIKSMIDGGGNAGYMSYFTDTNTITNSGVFWDAANSRLAINATSNIYGSFMINTGSGTTISTASQPNNSVSFGNPSAVNNTPTIVCKSDNSSGVLFIAATPDANTAGDFVFNARENDNSDFTTLTTPAFVFNRLSTRLLTINRNGYLGINTTSPDLTADVNCGTTGGLQLSYNDANGGAANKVVYGVTSSGDATVTPSGGKFGINSTSPLSILTAVTSAAKGNYGFNLVNSDLNKNRTTIAQSRDTSSICMDYTTTGKPSFCMKDNAGTILASVDTTGDFVYQFIHAVGSADSIAYSTGTTQNYYYKIATGAMTWHEAEGVTAAADSVRITKAGDYKIHIWLNATTSNANDLMRCKLYKNNAALPTSVGRFMLLSDGSGISEQKYFMVYYTFAANDYISWRIANLTGARASNISDVKIYVEKVPEN